MNSKKITLYDILYYLFLSLSFILSIIALCICYYAKYHMPIDNSIIRLIIDIILYIYITIYIILCIISIQKIIQLYNSYIRDKKNKDKDKINMTYKTVNKQSNSFDIISNEFINIPI
jgi:hypothetical protein